MEAQKQEVAELQKTLESKQDELDQLYEQTTADLVEIQGAEGATENQLAANEEELAANEQEMQEAIAAQKAAEEAAKQQALQQQQQQGGGTVSDGGSVFYPTTGGGVEGFNPIWPLPGVTYISAGYNGYPGHKGLDIRQLGRQLGLLRADLPQRHLHHPLCPFELRSRQPGPVCNGWHRGGL